MGSYLHITKHTLKTEPLDTIHEINHMIDITAPLTIPIINILNMNVKQDKCDNHLFKKINP